MITVYADGQPLIVKTIVADNLELRNGQSVTLAKAMEISTANATAFCAEMAVLRASGADVPDTTDLEELLGFGE